MIFPFSSHLYHLSPSSFSSHLIYLFSISPNYLTSLSPLSYLTSYPSISHLISLFSLSPVFSLCSPLLSVVSSLTHQLSHITTLSYLTSISPISPLPYLMYLSYLTSLSSLFYLSSHLNSPSLLSHTSVSLSLLFCLYLPLSITTLLSPPSLFNPTYIFSCLSPIHLSLFLLPYLSLMHHSPLSSITPLSCLSTLSSLSLHCLLSRLSHFSHPSHIPLLSFMLQLYLLSPITTISYLLVYESMIFILRGKM